MRVARPDRTWPAHAEDAEDRRSPGHRVTGCHGATPAGPGSSAPVHVCPGSGEPSPTIDGPRVSGGGNPDHRPRREPVDGHRQRPVVRQRERERERPVRTRHEQAASLGRQPVAAGSVSSTQPGPGAQLPWSTSEDPDVDRPNALRTTTVTTATTTHSAQRGRSTLPDQRTATATTATTRTPGRDDSSTDGVATPSPGMSVGRWAAYRRRPDDDRTEAPIDEGEPQRARPRSPPLRPSRPRRPPAEASAAPAPAPLPTGCPPAGPAAGGRPRQALDRRSARGGGSRGRRRSWPPLRLGLEHGPQPPQRVVQAGFHGPLGDAESGGDRGTVRSRA